MKTDVKLWSFKEILFEAEMNRHEDNDSADDAYILCGEDIDERSRSIEELRNMIYERGECHPPRTDDAFLLKFLRARKSIPARAHRLMVRWCNFRESNPHLWRDVDWIGLTRLGNIFEGVLYDRPDVGRLIICRLGLWDPDKLPVEDLIRGCLLLLEIGIMQPKLQILGGTALLDCEGLTMRHMRQLSPTIAIQAMNVMGYAFPIHQRGVHVINCSRFFETLFPIFRRFAPADELWKKVHFHGYDFTSLHRYIDPECLPRRYGGERDEVSLALWLTKIKQYKCRGIPRALFYIKEGKNKIAGNEVERKKRQKWEQGGHAGFADACGRQETTTAVIERGECNPRRLDDEYLLRFLRCRRFIPALAHKLLIRYEEFRHKYAYLYDCDAFGLQKVKNVYGGILPESPDNGRIILMRFGRWDTEAVPIDDVVRCALLMDEIASMQPKLQILGVTIIVDLNGLSLRHITHLTPTVASQIVSLMGVGFPLTVHGLHMINYSWILNSISYLFKRFTPQAVWKRMFFHGSDMASLHQHIHPQYLPSEYGGYCRHFISTEKWIEKVDAYKDDYLVKELRELGFYVKGGKDKVHSHWSYKQLIGRVKS